MLEKILNILDKKRHLFLLVLLLTSFFFRSPTLFNDFYASDELAAIVQAKEYLAGEVPGRDFVESKKPVYHLIFKASYALSHDYGWVYVHLLTILSVFATSLFIYLAGREIYDFKKGALAALLYSVLISSFNAEFMATNGEIIYNLPVAAGFYFLIKYLGRPGKISLYLVLALLMSYCAYQVKFHGVILLIFITLFFIFYYPYFHIKFSKKTIGRAALAVFLVTALSCYVLYRINPGNIVYLITEKLYYAMAPDRGFTPLHFFSRFIYRQGIFSLWHMVLWVPAALFLARLWRKRLRLPTLQESALALFFITTYMIVFGGGARLYYHYFMASYPYLCLVSSSVLLDGNFARPGFIRKRALAFVLVPGLFFFSWNVKDVVLKHFFPAGFYNEGPVLFWTRAVIMGTYNNYLLPGPMYAEAAREIGRLTSKGDRIFVWGHGPDLYYFSDRRMGNFTLWAKDAIFQIKDFYDKGDKESIELASYLENAFIEVMERKKPAAFIDTSSSPGLRIFQTRLIDQASFRVPPMVAKKFFPYVQKNYDFVEEINDIKIYLRKDFRKTE